MRRGSQWKRLEVVWIGVLDRDVGFILDSWEGRSSIGVVGDGEIHVDRYRGFVKR